MTPAQNTNPANFRIQHDPEPDRWIQAKDAACRQRRGHCRRCSILMCLLKARQFLGGIDGAIDAARVGGRSCPVHGQNGRVLVAAGGSTRPAGRVTTGHAATGTVILTSSPTPSRRPQGASACSLIPGLTLRPAHADSGHAQRLADPGARWSRMAWATVSGESSVGMCFPST